MVLKWFFIALAANIAYEYLSFLNEGGSGKMIICSCNVLSDKAIRKSLKGANPPRTPAQVHRRCGCKPECGRCVRSVRAIIEESRRGDASD